MSTEVNLDKLYENSIKILSDLIGFKTISGDDNNDLNPIKSDKILIEFLYIFSKFTSVLIGNN